MEVTNPNPDAYRSISAFARKNLGSQSFVIFNLINAFSNGDTLVLTDKEKILGTGAVIRVDDVNCALGCFMIRTRKQEYQAAQDMLMASLVARARQTSRSFVSCIRSDKFPDSSVLEKYGFEKQGIRAVFSGEISQIADNSCFQCNDAREGLALIKPDISFLFLNTCFRPVYLSLETLGALLTKGVIIRSRSDNFGLALVSKASCFIDSRGIKYMVPDYLLKKGVSDLQPVGEITLLGPSNVKEVLSSCSHWLSNQGIKHASVYSFLDDTVGYDIMKNGFDFQARHEIWIADLRGPMDMFVNF